MSLRARLFPRVAQVLISDRVSRSKESDIEAIHYYCASSDRRAVGLSQRRARVAGCLAKRRRGTKCRRRGVVHVFAA